MKLTIQRILRQHYTDFALHNSVSNAMSRAALQIMNCRTAAMGGHINSCPEGHYHQIAYNSCRHRSCPQCAWLPREQWLSQWKNRLLVCPHHHCIFTLPHELNTIWRYNKVAFTEVLFRAVSGTLQELLGDAKYLGGRVGLLCALHTWNQTLQEHIHLHVLVTAGGLRSTGGWLQLKKSCLLPRKVLMIKFRGKFKAMLRQKIASGDIKLPPTMTEQGLDRLLKNLSRVDWNVKILNRYPSGAGVATYLARYLKGGPIGNSRLISLEDGQVTFRYRIGSHEGGDGKEQGVTSLKVHAFIRRLLEHVPPRRLQTVRGYGLYSGNQHSRIAEARQALEMPVALREDEAKSWQELCEDSGYGKTCQCPHCGARLISHSEFKAGRGPPLKMEKCITPTEAA